jgi:hypothetical protein
MVRSKDQRNFVARLIAQGFVIERERSSNTAHLFLYIISPTGRRGVVTVPRKFGDPRSIANARAQLRKLT